MKKIKIIGCGNYLAYDEGVGIHVVKRLRNEILPGNVEVKELRNPGQLLLELIAGVDKLIIIDASTGNNKSGTVHKYTNDDGDLKDILANTIHAYNFYPVFELREKMYPNKLPHEIVVIGIEIEERQKFSIGLSHNVFSSLDKAIQVVLDELY